MCAQRKRDVVDRDDDPLPLPMSPTTWREIAADLALSHQQKRIVELILCGQQDKEIAATLTLSVPTIRTYLRRIFDRCGVDDRLSLVLLIFARAQTLVSADSCRCQQ